MSPLHQQMASYKKENSPIFYTGKRVKLRHDPKISFLAIDLLYEAKKEFFADHIGFILSCCNVANDDSGHGNYILKLEAAGLPTLKNGKLRITHQIEPKLGRCTRLVPLDLEKKVGCFDSGYVCPVSDFGCGKTFHFDVRSAEKHPLIDGHDAQLYSYDNEIGFWQKQDLGIDIFEDSDTKISTFYVPLSRNDKQQPIVVLFGTETGKIIFVDHKVEDKKVFWSHQDETGGRITRIKIIYEPDGKPIVVYANSSPNLRMLDYTTGESCDKNWTCDRKPEAEQLDFVQVGNMIVSCGRESSIASWIYKSRSEI